MHAAKWISEFPEVTKEGLGLLKGIQANIELEASAQPKQTYPVPIEGTSTAADSATS